jgi:hypothetical protein
VEEGLPFLGLQIEFQLTCVLVQVSIIVGLLPILQGVGRRV